MQCNQCGLEVINTIKVCPECGNTQFVNTQRPPPPPPPPQPDDPLPPPPNGGGAINSQDYEYAGFFRRFFAFIIDYVIVAFFMGFVAGIFDEIFGTNIVNLVTNEDLITIILLLALIIYHTFFESSKQQASLGKQLLRLKVVNKDAEKLSFANALGRNMGRIISNLTFGIGYLMVFFTERRQSLHDKMASTYILHKK